MSLKIDSAERKARTKINLYLTRLNNGIHPIGWLLCSKMWDNRSIFLLVRANFNPNP